MKIHQLLDGNAPLIFDILQQKLKRGVTVYFDRTKTVGKKIITNVELGNENIRLTMVEPNNLNRTRIFWLPLDTVDSWTLEKNDEGELELLHIPLNESIEEPLIISLLRQKERKNEQVYLPLGLLRYNLLKIVHIPGSAFSDGKWQLVFNRTGGTAITRLIYNNAEAEDWTLEKVNDVGAVRWKMEKI